MAPIYKLWQGRFTEAWHSLPEQEHQRLLGLVGEALSTAGGKGLVVCDAAWSNERWPYFGVEEFPDLDAVQRHLQILDEIRGRGTWRAGPPSARSSSFLRTPD